MATSALEMSIEAVHSSKGKGRIKAEFNCQILREAFTLMAVALLNTNSLAAPYMAFVGYTLDVITVLPPCPKLSMIEWSI